jgi:hypothetical protein
MWKVGLVIALASSSIPHRADANAAWAGYGAATCAQFAEIYRQNPSNARTMFIGWAQGFMSGLNHALLKEGGQDSANLLPASQCRCPI